MSKQTRGTLTTGALALVAASLATLLILHSLSGTGSVEASPAGEGQGAPGSVGQDVGKFLPPSDLFTSSGTLFLFLGTELLIPVNVTLSSAGLQPTTVTRTPPPYVTGVPIVTEIVQMELAGTAEGIGRVLVRQRIDQPSLGSVQDVVAEPTGDFVSGDSFFDVFVDVILEDTGQVLDTGLVPIRMQATNVTSLPPLGQPYFNLGQVELFEKGSELSVGFVVDVMHQPDDPFDPPDPTPDQDCVSSSAQSTITFDVNDVACASGEPLSLAQLSMTQPAIVDLDPPPYTTGIDIQTELVQLELTGATPQLGTVTVSERADRKSRGKIENVVASAGDFVVGDSFFDVFVEVDIPLTGQMLHTGQSTVRMENGAITELPPFQTSYLAPPATPQIVPLYDTATLVQVGWLCHASHILVAAVDCVTGVPVNIFEDGFESGDTSMWSATVPPP